MVSDLAGRARLGLPGTYAAQPSVPVYNCARYTEDLTWATAVAANSVKTGQVETAIVDGQSILFHRYTGNTFTSSLEHRYATAYLTPFVTGQKYLVSYYVFAPREQWWWLRTPLNTGDYGHGAKYCPANQIRRVWQVAVATSTSQLDQGDGNPITALGSGSGGNPRFVSQAFTGALDIWIGGLQIEPITAAYKDGIALIGDSTDAGSSGGKDAPKDFKDHTIREISTVLGAELNVPIFNRAAGGERLDQMDARWATDITPLAVRSWAVICGGGVNDVNQSRTLAQMQTSVHSMKTKADADGLVFIPRTMTPFTGTETTPAMATLRDQFNAWLLTTYGNIENGGNCIDISSVVQSPFNANALHPVDYGDGIHFGGMMKTQIGRYMARKIAAHFATTLKSPGTYLPNDPKTATAGLPGLVTTVTDRSTTITTGGTAQALMASNPARCGWSFQNISDTDMWINEIGGTAVADSPSVRVAAGASYTPAFVTTSAISIICATTGKKFTAREW